MTVDPPIAVTGATGALGGRVARRLADRGVPQRLVVRDASRAPRLPGAEVAEIADYRDPEGMRRALEGTSTLFLVSAEEAADRLDAHRTAVDAAAAAGVQRVTYTSFLGAAPDATFTLARDHHFTEEHLREVGLTTTSLRDSLYLDVLPLFAATGTIRGPADDGRFAPVSRDDIADVAFATLLDERHDGRSLDVTGPQLLTMAEVAAILSDVAGVPVAYVDETLEEAYASRAGQGEEYEIEGWVSSYRAIAVGELAVVTDVVAEVSGHPPQDLRAWLAANPEAISVLRAP